MIHLNLHKQSPGMCGPSSLKMVLSAYGIKKSEKYLAELTKTNPKKGCWEKNIVSAAKKLGLKGYYKRNSSSLKELKKLVEKENIPVIVNWFSPEESSHFSVVVGFEKDKILLAEPHFGEIKKYKIDWFMDHWFDFIGPPSCKYLLIRPIVVIYK